MRIDEITVVMICYTILLTNDFYRNHIISKLSQIRENDILVGRPKRNQAHYINELAIQDGM